MRFKLLMLLAVLGALVAFSGTAQAQVDPFKDVISVNFYMYPWGWSTDDQKETITMEPGQSAGVDAWLTENWINYEVPWDPAAPQAPFTLTSTTGSEATLNFITCRNGDAFFWDAPRTFLLGDGNVDMMDGHINSTVDANKFFEMTVTDIPYDTYDVIVYMGGNDAQWGNGKCKISFNGGSEKEITLLKLNDDESTFALTEIVDATTPGNYIVYKGVTGSSFSVWTQGNGFNHLGPTGFQFGIPDLMKPYPENEGIVAATDQQRLEWTNLAPVEGYTTVVDVWWGTEPNALAEGGLDFEKISSATADDFFEFVDSSTIGQTYYWRVDSYRMGLDNVNEPNRLEGQLWSYTAVSDPAPEITGITPDQMTWSGQGVPVSVDVTNLGSAPTSYVWTADTTPPADIMITGGDTATPTVTITKVPYSEAQIANAGFEADQQDEDGWGNATGWSGGGNWNPPADSYTGSAVPEGNMCAWTSGTMSQTLIETLAADTQYELTVQVGNSMRYDWPEYNVQLLAGGTVLAEDPNLNVSVPRDSWALVTVPFDSTGVNPDLLGKPLEIRLSSLGNQPGDYAELNFDDVKLTADPPFATPPVQTVTVTVNVSDSENPTPVTATVEIDVYDTACDVARMGEGKDNAADLDKDCEINIDDLKLQVSNEWLNDTSLTGPAANMEQTESIIPNGEFNAYKPGTDYKVIAAFPAGSYGDFTVNGHGITNNVGVFNCEDGTTSEKADMPGWIRSSTGNPCGSGANGIDGSTCLSYWGTWGGSDGARVRSAAPVGTISGGRIYTLAAMVTGAQETRILRLLADGVEVTPTSQVDPPDSAEWNEISRVYNASVLAAHVGKAITVEVGIDEPRDTDAGSAFFDNVTLTVAVADPYYPTVDGGVDMVTWSGQPVALTPTVLNNDPNDPQAPLSYLWTVDPTEGVELSDATAMAPTITITQPPLYTSYLADPGLNDLGGWDAFGDGTGYWGGSMSAPGYAIEGGQVGYVWNAPAGDHGFAQTLAATLETDTEYELSVWVGAPNGYTVPSGYKVQILVGETVLAENDANSLPDAGTAVQSTVTFDSTGVDAGLVGQPLEIRLLGIFAGVSNEEVDFDDAKLLINGKEMAIPGTSVPDPYTINLKLAVTLEGEGTVYDSLVIDVYDDACLAAAGADPAFTTDVGDINGDCITNLEDFAYISASWLVDYSPTGAIAKPVEESEE